MLKEESEVASSVPVAWPVMISNVRDPSSPLVDALLLSVFVIALFMLVADIVSAPLACAESPPPPSLTPPLCSQLLAEYVLSKSEPCADCLARNKAVTIEEPTSPETGVSGRPPSAPPSPEEGHPKRRTILAWIVATLFFSDANTMMVSPFLPGEAQVRPRSLAHARAHRTRPFSPPPALHVST